MKREAKPKLTAAMRTTMLRLARAQKARLADRIKALPLEDVFLRDALEAELGTVEQVERWLA